MPSDLLISEHHSERRRQEYLRGLDESLLIRRIQRYMKTDRSGWSAAQFQSEIYKVLQHPTLLSFHFDVFPLPFQVGQRFFRARKIKAEHQITHVSNVMHAPHGASPGRLNKSEESLLYTSCDLHTTVLEVNAEPGDLMAFAQFSVTEEFCAAHLGGERTRPNLSISDRRKMQIINRFLSRLISQRDKEYGNHDYAETEFVVKDLFDYPPEFSKGWAYPSYADRGNNGVNVAFRPEQALEVLDLDVVLLAQVSQVDQQSSLLHFFRKLKPSQDGRLIPDKSFQ